jgi:hypothetical protein
MTVLELYAEHSRLLAERKRLKTRWQHTLELAHRPGTNTAMIAESFGHLNAALDVNREALGELATLAD